VGGKMKEEKPQKLNQSKGGGGSALEKLYQSLPIRWDCNLLKALLFFQKES
jgi:hypothetical protein